MSLIVTFLDECVKDACYCHMQESWNGQASSHYSAHTRFTLHVPSFCVAYSAATQQLAMHCSKPACYPGPPLIPI